MKSIRATVFCLMLLGLSSGNSFAAYKYTPGPGITDTSILKSKGISWFNVSESCTLKAKATDKDCRCLLPDGEPIELEDNYIDNANTEYDICNKLPATGFIIPYEEMKRAIRNGKIDKITK